MWYAVFSFIYWRSWLTGVIEVMFLPPEYTTVHNLTSEHAFGSAIILKSSLPKRVLPVSPSNYYSCVIVDYGSQTFLFTSVYCLPSTPDIPSLFKNILLAFPSTLIKNVVICADLNGKSPLWDSNCLDQTGKGIEALLPIFWLNLANEQLSDLEHTPRSTSFVELTLFGDRIII